MKRMKRVLAIALALALIPISNMTVYANEEETKVSTIEELNKAVEAKASKIILTADIELEKKIDISYDVEIDGKGHKLFYKLDDNSKWTSAYSLQFYKNTAKLSNIVLSGGNAGLLINGADVTLEGTIDLSGNYYGGIELTKGANVTDAPKLDITNATFKYEDHPESSPLIWIDKLEYKEVQVKAKPFTYNISKTEKGQPTLVFEPTPITDEASLIKALVTDKDSLIELKNDFVTTEKISVTHDVKIIGNGKTITGDKKGEKLFYGLQFYNVDNAIVSDIKMHSMDAAILVNGSNLTLVGDIDVSNNNLGGIEVSQGETVTKIPTLNLKDAKLINSSEDYTKPTIWVVGDLVDGITFGDHKFFDKSAVVEGQVQFYKTDVKSPQEIKEEKDLEEAIVETRDILESILKELEDKNLKVSIDENTHQIVFTKLNAKEDFSKEELVELFSKIVSHDKVKSFKLDNESYTNEDLKEVKDALVKYLDKLSETKSRTVSDLITQVNEHLDLAVVLTASNEKDVEQKLDAKFERTENNDVDEDKEVPKEETKDELVKDDAKEESRKDDVKEESKKDDEKAKSKTPVTGLSNVYSIYLLIIATGLGLIGALKYKKKINSY